MSATAPIITPASHPGGIRGFLEDRRYRRFMERSLHRALTPPPPEAFGAFGPGSIIVPPTRLVNPSRIFIGTGVVIHEGSWLSVEPGRFDDVTTRLVIGDFVKIGRYTQISMCGEVEIGQEALISDQVLIADTFHEPHATVRPNDTPLARPKRTTIGAGAALDLGSTILPGVSVGENAYVCAAAVVTADVPAGATVAGNPARVVSGPTVARRS
jgi:acetyltransferase-like isoleucine patch superfamily enzyme